MKRAASFSFAFHQLGKHYICSKKTHIKAFSMMMEHYISFVCASHWLPPQHDGGSCDFDSWIWRNKGSAENEAELFFNCGCSWSRWELGQRESESQKVLIDSAASRIDRVERYSGLSSRCGLNNEFTRTILRWCQYIEASNCTFCAINRVLLKIVIEFFSKFIKNSNSLYIYIWILITLGGKLGASEHLPLLFFC